MTPLKVVRLFGLVLALSLISCQTDPVAPEQEVNDEPVSLDDLVIPEGFDFATTGVTTISLSLAQPAAGGGDPPRVAVGVPDSDGNFDLIIEGFISDDGAFSVQIPLPLHLDRVLVRFETEEGVRTLTLPIVAGTATYPGAVLADVTQPGSLAPAFGGGPSTMQGGPMGVPSDLEGYPIAYVSYHPSQSEWGTIAFEDNWPSKGDYDFNDLVLSYHVVQYRNPGYGMVAMEFFLRVEAAGARFRNGFGFALPVSRSRIIRAYGGLSARADELGMEPGQDQAVFILFDDPAQVIPGGSMVNTLPGNSLVSGTQMRFVVHFQTPLFDRELGTPPFNPFLIVDGDRGREVHLIGQSPTALMNGSYLGTSDDAGSFSTGNGLPWALLLPTSWSWPVENVPVNEAHLEFTDWAASGGTEYSDWYIAKPGNRKHESLIR
jgi:LruC domain-containing protein